MAEDAVQNGFLKLVKNSDSLKLADESEDRLVAYVFQSVRNAAIDLGRSAKRQKTLSQKLFESFDQTKTPENPSDSVLTSERDSILRSAIDGLDEKDQEAVVLKVFADLTFEQAGEVANVSPKSIASRYRRALEKLQNQLKGKL